MFGFNSRDPAGRDVGLGMDSAMANVSTHATLRVATRPKLSYIFCRRSFNSRDPAGRDKLIHSINWLKKCFNSRDPAGRDWNAGGAGRLLECFNSRDPAGRDPARY